MDNNDVNLDNELARRTAVLVDSSDDEPTVAPIDDSTEDEFAPDLREIFSRYSIASNNNSRRMTFIIRRGRVRGRRRAIMQRLDIDNEIEDRLFDADTEIALRISMDTYKPAVQTVTKELIDAQCPVIKARHQKEKCTVCQEDVKRNENIRILPCGHYLHDECMIGWYTTGNAVCPICRDKTFENKKEKDDINILI